MTAIDSDILQRKFGLIEGVLRAAGGDAVALQALADIEALFEPVDEVAGVELSGAEIDTLMGRDINLGELDKASLYGERKGVDWDNVARGNQEHGPSIGKSVSQAEFDAHVRKLESTPRRYKDEGLDPNDPGLASPAPARQSGLWKGAKFEDDPQALADSRTGLDAALRPIAAEIEREQKRKRPPMSEEAKAKIAAAQKARWARHHESQQQQAG